MGTAFVAAGLSLCAVASASAQATFRIDTSIPPGIARELKRHGIEVPKERVRGTLEIRDTARDGIRVRLHEAKSAAAPREARTDGTEPAAGAAPSATAGAAPSATASRPSWVDVPSEVAAPHRCSAGLSTSGACAGDPVVPEAKTASLPAAAPVVPETKAAALPAAAPVAKVASLPTAAAPAPTDSGAAALPAAVPPAPDAPAAAPAPRMPAASGPMGEWLVADGSARIGIHACGANLCGTVTSSKEKGRVGERILRDMKPDGENRWTGTILDPRSGKIYQSTMTLKGSILRVDGCLMGLLCGGETWTRG